jgi:hypothetical protein
MTKFLMLSSVLAAGLMLGGCVDRAQADEKLAAACRAGVMSLLPEGVTLGEVRNKSFSPFAGNGRCASCQNRCGADGRVS